MWIIYIIWMTIQAVWETIGGGVRTFVTVLGMILLSMLLTSFISFIDERSSASHGYVSKPPKDTAQNTSDNNASDEKDLTASVGVMEFVDKLEKGKRLPPKKMKLVNQYVSSEKDFILKVRKEVAKRWARNITKETELIKKAICDGDFKTKFGGRLRLYQRSRLYKGLPESEIGIYSLCRPFVQEYASDSLKDLGKLAANDSCSGYEFQDGRRRFALLLCGAEFHKEKAVLEFKDAYNSVFSQPIACENREDIERMFGSLFMIDALIKKLRSTTGEIFYQCFLQEMDCTPITFKGSNVSISSEYEAYWQTYSINSDGRLTSSPCGEEKFFGETALYACMFGASKVFLPCCSASKNSSQE